MTISGLLVMLISVGVVTLLFAWCIARVMRAPAEKTEHLAGAELHTPDMEEE